MKNDKHSSCCLAKILRVIDILQKNASDDICVEEGCTKSYLGERGNILCYNTRPITLYTKTNALFTSTYELNGTTGTSSVFRVENVEGCCATLRVLAPSSEDPATPYQKTSSFVTVNLNCMCALKCLTDIRLDCI